MMPPIAAIPLEIMKTIDPDSRDVDACAPRSLGVAADGVDVTAEGRPLGEERQTDEEDDDQDTGQRQTERRSWTSAWLQMATSPKAAIATPITFAIDDPEPFGSRHLRAACAKQPPSTKMA